MPSVRRQVLARTLLVLAWVVFPAALLLVALSALVHGPSVDFDANIWEPGKAVVAGRSPYPRPELAQLIAPFFLYPPLLLGVAVPLSLLPHDLARALFFAAEVFAVVGALRLVDVTDWRVLFWAALCYPVFDALLLGNPTLLLLPLLAAAWRWRERWAIAGIAVGIAGAFKLLVWPLGVWLLATRRLRATVLAALCAALGILVPWALLGFHGLRDYTEIVDLYTRYNGGPRAISVTRLGQELGLPAMIAGLVKGACGLALLAAAVAAGLRGRAGDDRAAFSLALVAALVLSPVVWIHYAALLLIPLALARPAFDRAWLVVCALWIFPLLARGGPHTVVVDGRVLTSAGPVPTIAQLCVGLGFMAYVAVVTSSGRRPTLSTGI